MKKTLSSKGIYWKENECFTTRQYFSTDIRGLCALALLIKIFLRLTISAKNVVLYFEKRDQVQADNPCINGAKGNKVSCQMEKEERREQLPLKLSFSIHFFMVT